MDALHRGDKSAYSPGGIFDSAEVCEQKSERMGMYRTIAEPILNHSEI